MTKHGIASAINFGLLVGTAIGILVPAFVDNKSLTQIIVSLFEPELTQSFLLKWLILIIFILCLYIFVLERMYKNTPITLISTGIDIDFIKNDGSEVRVRRTQLLRANQLNVSAYFMKASATSPSGRIPKANIHAQIYCDDRNFNSSLRIFGRESGQLNIFHRFGGALPYSWYLCLIPAVLMNHDHDKMPSFFRRRIAQRKFEHVYIDEYNVEFPCIAFTAEKYPQKNLSITIDFNGLNPKDIEVWRVKNNVVIDMNYKKENGSDVVKIFVSKLQEETIRIMWKPPGAGRELIENGS